jgi:hypothetical protein
VVYRQVLLNNFKALYQWWQQRSSNRLAPSTSTSPRCERKNVHTPGAVFIMGVAVLALFLATRAVTHVEAEDSVHYIRQITNGHIRDLFYPNHLLFNSVNWITYQAWIMLGYVGSAELPTQVNNSIAGAFTVCLLMLTMQRLGFTLLPTLLAAIGLTSSYGFWAYSAEAETYVQPLPFLWLALHRLVVLSQRNERVSDFVWLGIYVSLATLLHQQHVFMVFIIGFAIAVLWWRSGAYPPVEYLLQRLALYGGICAVLIGTPYLLVPYLVYGLTDLRDIFDWSKGAAGTGIFTYTPWAWSNVLKSAVGISHALWGMHFLFGFDLFNRLMFLVFPNKILDEELLIAANLSRVQVWFCLTALIISAISMTRLLISAVCQHPWQQHEASSRDIMDRALLTITVVVIPMWLAYGLWNTVWEPSNAEFWIAPLSFIWLFLFWSPKSFTGGVSIREKWGATAVVTLFLCTFLGSILPQLNRDVDYWYKANEPLIRYAHADDVIITEGGWISKGYLMLYTPAEIISPSGHSIKELDELIGSTRGNVYISSWVEKPPPGVDTQLVNRDDAAIRAWFASVKSRLTFFAETPMQRIWRVRAY